MVRAGVAVDELDEEVSQIPMVGETISLVGEWSTGRRGTPALSPIGMSVLRDVPPSGESDDAPIAYV